MSRIKVLRIIYDLQIGGVQRMLLQSLPLLRDAGVDTSICCLKKQGDMAKQFVEKGFPVSLVRFGSRLDPFGLIRLRKLILNNSFTLVHSHMYASNIAANVALFMARRIRLINSYHSVKPFHTESQKRMAVFTKGIPDRFIAVSEAVRKPLLEANLPPEKITIIHNGVYCPETYSPIPKRAPGSPLELVWAGRFVGQKRVFMLLDIAELCLKKKIPIHLTLVGDGPQYKMAQRKVKATGLENTITFAGWKSDILPFIQKADLYISASNREGFPNTLLEVCAQGRGFVVADIPPNREVLDSLEAGYVVGDNLKEWADILFRIHKNPGMLRNFSKEAFKIAQMFSIERTCRKTLDLYDKIISKM